MAEMANATGWVSFCCTVNQKNEHGTDHIIQHFWRPLKGTEASFKRLSYPDRLPVAKFHQSYRRNFPVATVVQKYERRRLQRLAKAHGIRANAKSTVIAEKLRQHGVCLKSAVSARKRRRTPSTQPRAKRPRNEQKSSPVKPLDATLQKLGRELHAQAADSAGNLLGEEHPSNGSVESLDGSSLTFLKEQNGFFARWAPDAWDRFLLAHVLGAGAGQRPLPHFLVWLGSQLFLRFVPVAGPLAPGNRPTHVRTAWNGEICRLLYGQDAEAMQSLLSKVGRPEVGR